MQINIRPGSTETAVKVTKTERRWINQTLSLVNTVAKLADERLATAAKASASALTEFVNLLPKDTRDANERHDNEGIGITGGSESRSGVEKPKKK